MRKEGSWLGYRWMERSSGWPTSRPSTRILARSRWGGSSARIVLTVEDPEAVFARAIGAGATVVWPVADQPYGWRLSQLADPFGHHWEIGKPQQP